MATMIGALVILFSAFVQQQTLAVNTDVTVVKISDSRVIHEVDPEYLSFNLDTSYLEPEVHKLLNFSSVRLHTTLQGLTPAIFRVGGSPADWLIFNRPQRALNASGIQPVPVVMTKSDWDDLVSVTSAADIRLLFDLDLQQRFGKQWDPSSAIELFDYCIQKGYGHNLDWELGNEPGEYYARPTLAKLSGTQIGRDFVSLYKVIKSYPEFSGSRVVGPDVVGESQAAKEIFKGYLAIAGQYVNAVTIHHYYFRGDVASWTDYVNPKHFQNLQDTLSYNLELIQNSTYPTMPLWIGETSDAWHGGTPNVSDRFVSAFLWLDKLGLAARNGVSVVMRQTFWGHDYPLTDRDFNPNPDYWLSLLHKRLVGTKVLNVTTQKGPITTRVYSHCARQQNPGAVVVFALNCNLTSTSLLTFTDKSLQSQTLELYLAEPQTDLLSKTVLLNGIPLKMPDERTLPEFKPIPIPASNGVVLPPTTYAFMVFPDANFGICK